LRLNAHALLFRSLRGAERRSVLRRETHALLRRGSGFFALHSPSPVIPRSEATWESVLRSERDAKPARRRGIRSTLRRGCGFVVDGGVRIAEAPAEPRNDKYGEPLRLNAHALLFRSLRGAERRSVLRSEAQASLRRGSGFLRFALSFPGHSEERSDVGIRTPERARRQACEAARDTQSAPTRMRFCRGRGSTDCRGSCGASQ